MNRLINRTLCLLLLAALQVIPAVVPPAAAQTGLSADTRKRLMESLNRAEKFLRSAERPDGTFDNNPGVTGLAATALLRQPGVNRAQAVKSLDKTLTYVRGLAKPDGGLYVKDIPHYITAVSMMTLAAADQPQDRTLLARGRAYLAEHLLDDGEGVPPSDKFYGGLGYGGTSDGGRADIISLEYGLRALKEAGAAANDPAFEKALKFLERTQNNSETNDQDFASNDGGFIYYPGYSQVEGTTRSYGSASYAGIMSYTWANVRKSDARVQAVLKWVRDNYTVEENPGIGTKALYYYYMVFAKALEAVDEDVIVDAKGQRHNWREDLARKLLALQGADGSWVNADPREMQNNKVLVTSFTMSAIHAILQ